MAITIGSNIASLMAQRRLGQTSNELGSVYERLASGQRINRASDDAAGLAISSSLRADQRIFQQGIRNANDGISLLNIAGGALDSLSDVVIRLQELAEQSANGTYGTKQRSALNEEAQALSAEYSRILQSTSFNGISLFDGSLGNGLRIQVGGNYIDASIGGDVGTGTFENQRTVTTSWYPYDAKTADVNGDGHMDVVTANLGSTSIGVFLGRGDGSFQAEVSYQTAGTQPYGITFGDFNKDGVLDIASADYASNSLGVFFGRGNGTFQTAISLAAGVNPFSLHAADIDGDGDSDLLSADLGSSRIGVYLSNGDGTFQARVSYAAGGVGTVNTGDFNDDGKLDMVSSNQSTGALVVFLGNGDGSFQSSVNYSAGGSAHGVLVEDFNGDGKLDLAAADVTGGAMSVLFGNGNGTFQTRLSYAVGASPIRTAAGDINGDGALDLVSVHQGSGGFFSVILNNGDGTFQASQSFATGVTPWSAHLGDVNADGVLDFMTAGGGSSSFSILSGDSVDGTHSLPKLDLSSQFMSLQALPILQQRIQLLAEQRGVIGASQSRLEVAIRNLSTQSENYAAAASRISDTDIAADAAAQVRLQILQSVSSAILAQANTQPQIALRLLDGPSPIRT